MKLWRVPYTGDVTGIFYLIINFTRIITRNNHCREVLPPNARIAYCANEFAHDETSKKMRIVPDSIAIYLKNISANEGLVGTNQLF